MIEWGPAKEEMIENHADIVHFVDKVVSWSFLLVDLDVHELIDVMLVQKEVIAELAKKDLMDLLLLVLWIAQHVRSKKSIWRDLSHLIIQLTYLSIEKGEGHFARFK